MASAAGSWDTCDRFGRTPARVAGQHLMEARDTEADTQ